MEGLPTSLAVVLSSEPTLGGGFAYSEAVLRALSTRAFSEYSINAICLNEGWLDCAKSVGIPALRCEPYRKTIRKFRRLLLLSGATLLWKAIRPRVSPIHRAVRRCHAQIALFPCEQHLSLDSPVPAIAPIHDLMYHFESRFPEVGAWRTRLPRQRLDSLVARQSAAVLVDSEMGARHVSTLFAGQASRVCVLPYISMRPTPAPTESYPTLPLGIPEPFFLYPAQFWLHKNHLGLVEALRHLNTQGLRVNLVCCGSDKNCKSQVLARTRELGLESQLVMLGFVPDETLCRLYRCARALVMPSFFGPTNIPPLEAMQFGCPVAVSDVYGMKEQLGDAALYFNPHQPAEIAEAMRILWTDESVRTRLRARGFERAKAGSLSIFAARLAEICGTVARGTRAPEPASRG